MAHLSPEELIAKFHAACDAGKEKRVNVSQIQSHQALAEACPAFVPNLLQLARSLLLEKEPITENNLVFARLQHLLEQAVQVSARSAPSLIELAYFHDSIHNDFKTARSLYEEGAAKALASLEDAWAGLLSSFVLDHQIPEALALARQAKTVFPESARIMHRIHETRDLAIAAGLLPPESTDL
ncbi:hypothetical protein [Stigmatella hybrida]|uniref:hypothetical protein n=1 Tax=Stigmatella hybrida TaxID=394097 RepID=UPI001CDA8182|nr:hypothetical protein [Stigmatella hybrida]